MPLDRGMPLPLRILALLGALSFVLLGISSLLPLLRRPAPQPLPLQPSLQALFRQETGLEHFAPVGSQVPVKEIWASIVAE